MAASGLTTDCDPMTKNGSLTLNPCGLIAASYFNGNFSAHLLKHQPLFSLNFLILNNTIL